MRHRKAGSQLGRNTSHRRAMLRNMVTALFKNERIETTDAKAKAIRPLAEKMITLAKRGDLHARRQALAYLQEKAVAHRLFGEMREQFMDRQGGYLRIVKKGVREGDGAPMSIVQLISSEDGRQEKKKKKSKAAKPRARKPKAAEKAQPEKAASEEGAPATGS